MYQEQQHAFIDITMIIRGEIKYYCVFHTFFGSKSLSGVMSQYFWKCPHLFKGGGTLSPIWKFLGRTLIAATQKLVFSTNYRFMQVKSTNIAENSPLGAFCNSFNHP